jgi:ferritin-like metal-binding protein YciE
MKIEELIQQELADTHTHQVRWQAQVKQILLEEGPGNRDRALERIKVEAQKIGERLVKRSVGLGLQWLAEGEA